MHHPCECPACRFKEFNYEQLKEKNETKNALLLEAATRLENQIPGRVIFLPGPTGASGTHLHGPTGASGATGHHATGPTGATKPVKPTNPAASQNLALASRLRAAARG